MATDAADVTAPAFAALDGLDDWRSTITRYDATFGGADLAAAAGFASDVVGVVDGLPSDDHPDIDIRPQGRIRISFPAHAHRTTTEVVDAARVISALAAERGLTSDPTASFSAEIGIDALDIDAVRPFWQAILGYEPAPPDDDGRVTALVDPRRFGPDVWFQQMDAIRPERNHIHLDVLVPHDVAEERLAATLAAGGRLLDDGRAPMFWVLADVEGNEACICTWIDRD